MNGKKMQSISEVTTGDASHPVRVLAIQILTEVEHIMDYHDSLIGDNWYDLEDMITDKLATFLIERKCHDV